MVLSTTKFHEGFGFWADRSSAIDLFRLVAIYCVVMVHVPYVRVGVADLHSIGDVFSALPSQAFFDDVVVFLKFGIGRVASPALSVVSAWFLIRGLEKRTNWGSIISKIRSLLVPFLIWNTIYLSFFLVLFVVFRRDEFDFHEGIARAFLNNTFNLYRWPANDPLHFLIDLFEVSVVYTVVRKYLFSNAAVSIAIAIICPVILTYFGSSKYWFGDNYASPAPRVDVAFFFLVGTITYKYQNWIFGRSVVRCLTSAPVLIGLAATSFLVSQYMYYVIACTSVDFSVQAMAYLYLTLAMRAFCSLLVFGVTLKVYERFRVQVARKVAFRTFCSHALIIWITSAAVSRYFTGQTAELYIVLFLCGVTGGLLVSFTIDRVSRLWPSPCWSYI